MREIEDLEYILEIIYEDIQMEITGSTTVVLREDMDSPDPLLEEPRCP